MCMFDLYTRTCIFFHSLHFRVNEVVLAVARQPLCIRSVCMLSTLNSDGKMAQVKKKKKPVQLCNKFDLRSRSPAGQFWSVAVSGLFSSFIHLCVCWTCVFLLWVTGQDVCDCLDELLNLLL